MTATSGQMRGGEQDAWVAPHRGKREGDNRCGSNDRERIVCQHGEGAEAAAAGGEVYGGGLWEEL